MFRVAVTQMNAYSFDKHRNLRLVGRLLKASSKRSAQLVVFPELCVTGYSVLRDAVRVAESVPGPSTRFVSSLASELGLNVVIGMVEEYNGGVYDSAVLIDSSGDVTDVYRKVNLWAAEKEVFKRGSKPVVFDVDGVRVGVGICYDLEFPEYSRSLALSGAELIVYPSAQPAECRDRVNVYLRSRALENGVYVGFSDLAGVEGEYSFAGGSTVVGPNGARLTRSIRGEYGLATCDVDRELIRKERRANPYLEDLALSPMTRK
jgi:Predicted amidohydrolase